ncbi:MAG TPA: DUF1800 family protein, partial [Mycobacteriales bacterium]|nr:DUF1800 family protein [Mycobacteriales bacterium]
HWLDGVDNAPPQPNENYAREFFELFTLGRFPQIYSEGDVREAARAFTGWTANPILRRGEFRAQRHDNKSKRILGRTVPGAGASEYLTVVDLALEQPIASRFVAAKLVAGLAYLPAMTDLLRAPDPLVRKVADSLRSSRWQLLPALRTLFRAEEFRARGGRRQLVRSPVEVVVATCRALGLAADDMAWHPLLRRMGQQLFEPPNVGGWPGGQDWLTPSTVIARYDLGLTAVARARAANVALPTADDVPGWTRRLALPELSANTTAAVRAFLASKAGGTAAERQTGVAALLLASPEWTVV